MVVAVGRLGEVAHAEAVLQAAGARGSAAQDPVAQHLAQLLLEVAVEPAVQEGVDAGAAHSEQLQQQVHQLQIPADMENLVSDNR